MPILSTRHDAVRYDTPARTVVNPLSTLLPSLSPTLPQRITPYRIQSSTRPISHHAPVTLRLASSFPPPSPRAAPYAPFCTAAPPSPRTPSTSPAHSPYLGTQPARNPPRILLRALSSPGSSYIKPRCLATYIATTRPSPDLRPDLLPSQSPAPHSWASAVPDVAARARRWNLRAWVSVSGVRR